jgi:hypothetical protein
MKTPRISAAFSFRWQRIEWLLLAHRALECAIDLLVRRVAAGLRSLGACRAWLAVLCALLAALAALEADEAAASAADLAAAASEAAALAAASAASMRASSSLLLQPVAVTNMTAAAATVSVFTIAVFIVIFLGD